MNISQLRMARLEDFLKMFAIFLLGLDMVRKISLKSLRIERTANSDNRSYWTE